LNGRKQKHSSSGAEAGADRLSFDEPANDRLRFCRFEFPGCTVPLPALLVMAVAGFHFFPRFMRFNRLV
jgi:hypothetical protein